MSLGCTAKGRHVLSLKRRWFLLLFWSSADYHFWSLMNDCFYLVLWKGTIYCSFERVLLTQLRICTSASVKSAKTRLCQRSGLSHCFSEGFPGARSVVGLLSKAWRWRRGFGGKRLFQSCQPGRSLKTVNLFWGSTLTSASTRTWLA